MPKFSSLMRELAQISTHWLLFFPFPFFFSSPFSTSVSVHIYTAWQLMYSHSPWTVKVCPFRSAQRRSASDGQAASDKTPLIFMVSFHDCHLAPRSANLKALLSHMSSSGVVESNCCVNSNRRGKSVSRTLKAESDRQPNASRRTR